MRRLLLVVDPQFDFISGTLPVPGAVAAMNGLASHVLTNNGKYAAKLVTLDFHPWEHCSFVDNGGKWPRHCAAWTQGASIWPPLAQALFSTEGPVEIGRKGMEAGTDEYSIFKSGWFDNKAHAWLKDMDVVDICGIAGDICVLNTLKDGMDIFGSDKFNLLHQFSPSLDGGEALRKYYYGE